MSDMRSALTRGAFAFPGACQAWCAPGPVGGTRPRGSVTIEEESDG